MTIWYDLTELYFRSSGKIRFYGIARVVAEVAYEMARLYPATVFVVFDESRQKFFQVKPVFDLSSDDGIVSLDIDRSTIPSPLHIVRQNAATHLRVAARISNAITRFRDRKLLSSWPVQMKPVELDNGVLFTAARPKVISRFVSYLEKTHSKVRLSVLLHDLIPLFEDYASGSSARNFREDNSHIIRRSGQIVANSRFTMLQLQDFAARGLISALPEDLPVVPLAHECRDAGDADIPLPERPYILGVGMTAGRKNLEAVLIAQQIMLSRGQQPPLLVLAGASRPRMVEKLRKRFPAFAGHVMLVDSPPQAHLAILYRHAIATIMASRMEGWGLPAGESMWLGTPAILARTSSLPEVGGDLALYFDPEKPEELAAILADTTLLENSRARLQLEKQSLRSWEQVARELHAALTAYGSRKGDFQRAS